MGLMFIIISKFHAETSRNGTLQAWPGNPGMAKKKPRKTGQSKTEALLVPWCGDKWIIGYFL